MSMRVDAYMTGGTASGVLARAGTLREALEHDGVLALEQVRWQPLDGPAVPASPTTIPIDDVLIAVADDDPMIPVHAAWHSVRLDVGPYTVEGEMPTLPGFDPGRALTRPSGEFVLLKDVAIGLRTDIAPPPPLTPVGHHALINRYCVESVACDLMLGFFFPGARMIQSDVDEADVAETGAV